MRAISLTGLLKLPDPHEPPAPEPLIVRKRTNTRAKFEELRGLALFRIVVRKDADDQPDEVRFETGQGLAFILRHDQDCCEHVHIAEIIGNPDEHANSIIVSAEESSQNGNESDEGSQTWTFYRLTTTAGPLVFRWLGESNGYYSEDVSCYRETVETRRPSHAGLR